MESLQRICFRQKLKAKQKSRFFSKQPSFHIQFQEAVKLRCHVMFTHAFTALHRLSKALVLIRTNQPIPMECSAVNACVNIMWQQTLN